MPSFRPIRSAIHLRGLSNITKTKPGLLHHVEPAQNDWGRKLRSTPRSKLLKDSGLRAFWDQPSELSGGGLGTWAPQLKPRAVHNFGCESSVGDQLLRFSEDAELIAPKTILKYHSVDGCTHTFENINCLKIVKSHQVPI